MQYIRNNIGYLLSVMLLWCFVNLALAKEIDLDKELTEEEIEAWFNDDADERASAVNEGDLVFLSSPPDKAPHHLHNILYIDNNSLKTGWVELTQCHSQLDAVPDTQIVYRYRRMKNLRIDSFTGIKQAWVEGNSVQLENIVSGARLCIKADVGIFYKFSDGIYVLKNGPFHRKFLDGYYPMRVTLEIKYPEDAVQFFSISPEKQSGFTVKSKKGKLRVDTIFEGMLMTEIRFKKPKDNGRIRN